MMINFGDGVSPSPQVIIEVLRQTREFLHTAIRDARRIYGKLEREYRVAKIKRNFHAVRKGMFKNLNKKKDDGGDATISTKPGGQRDGTKWSRILDPSLGSDLETLCSNNADPDMDFRAESGYDNMAFKPRCGFNYLCLTRLFPEEIMSYERWEKFNNSVKRGKKSKRRKGNNRGGEEEDEEVEEEEEDEEEDFTTDLGGDEEEGGGGEGKGGKKVEEEYINDDGVAGAEESDDSDFEGYLKTSHTGKRMVTFDLRTIEMEVGWYRTFSEKYRSGSFLGRASKSNVQGSTRKEHFKHPRDEKNWKNLQKTHARFLYWLGFEPGRGGGLPDKDTTLALAYLAHDALGRIVERGIMNLVSRLREEGRKAVVLRGEEQLTMEDIRGGMEGMGLAGEITKGKVALYWGPGCERRMEEELELGVQGGVGGGEVEGETQEEEEEDIFKDARKMDMFMEKGSEAHGFFKQQRSNLHGGALFKGNRRVKQANIMSKDIKAFQQRVCVTVKAGGKILNKKTIGGGYKFLIGFLGVAKATDKKEAIDARYLGRQVFGGGGRRGVVCKWRREVSGDVLYGKEEITLGVMWGIDNIRGRGKGNRTKVEASEEYYWFDLDEYGKEEIDRMSKDLNLEKRVGKELTNEEGEVGKVIAWRGGDLYVVEWEGGQGEMKWEDIKSMIEKRRLALKREREKKDEEKERKRMVKEDPMDSVREQARDLEIEEVQKREKAKAKQQQLRVEEGRWVRSEVRRMRLSEASSRPVKTGDILTVRWKEGNKILDFKCKAIVRTASGKEDNRGKREGDVGVVSVDGKFEDEESVNLKKDEWWFWKDEKEEEEIRRKLKEEFRERKERENEKGGKEEGGEGA
ncbi:hypothetical protein TrCOL_g277 [Triparma columacea]|uniref:Uncharacterized protein n=1 Tax=Triparma columacea TaxID=722753 RepID=A0A9W7L6D9_9STRA|nr:hypothetical protein TrCOL_g277 [Triparma columacea]